MPAIHATLFHSSSHRNFSNPFLPHSTHKTFPQFYTLLRYVFLNTSSCWRPASLSSTLHPKSFSLFVSTIMFPYIGKTHNPGRGRLLLGYPPYPDCSFCRCRHHSHRHHPRARPRLVPASWQLSGIPFPSCCVYYLYPGEVLISVTVTSSTFDFLGFQLPLSLLNLSLGAAPPEKLVFSTIT